MQRGSHPAPRSILLRQHQQTSPSPPASALQPSTFFRHVWLMNAGKLLRMRSHNTLLPLIAWSGLVMMLCSNTEARAQTTLRVAVNTAWNMPFGQVEHDQLQAGFFSDLYQAIGQHLSLPVVQVILPRKRIEDAAQNGEIDLRCFINPKWTLYPGRYTWSKPLFTLRDVVFAGTGTPASSSLDAMPAGAAVSAALGYVYPGLDDRFNSGRLRRDDAQTEGHVLAKVSANRTTYGVVNAISLAFYKKTVPHHNLADWSMEVESQPIHCAVPAKASVTASHILDAIEHLRKIGQLDLILSKYR